MKILLGTANNEMMAKGYLKDQILTDIDATIAFTEKEKQLIEKMKESGINKKVYEAREKEQADHTVYLNFLQKAVKNYYEMIDPATVMLLIENKTIQFMANTTCLHNPTVMAFIDVTDVPFVRYMDADMDIDTFRREYAENSAFKLRVCRATAKALDAMMYEKPATATMLIERLGIDMLERNDA